MCSAPTARCRARPYRAICAVAYQRFIEVRATSAPRSEDHWAPSAGGWTETLGRKGVIERAQTIVRGRKLTSTRLRFGIQPVPISAPYSSAMASALFARSWAHATRRRRRDRFGAAVDLPADLLFKSLNWRRGFCDGNRLRSFGSWRRSFRSLGNWRRSFRILGNWRRSYPGGGWLFRYGA